MRKSQGLAPTKRALQTEDVFAAPTWSAAYPIPAKNGIFEPFIYKNDHFAKTGSGQTQGKLKNEVPFFAPL
jgi:hypothetical protein